MARDIKLYLLVLHVISESYVTHHILWPSHFEAAAPSEDGASLDPGYCCLSQRHDKLNKKNVTFIV